MATITSINSYNKDIRNNKEVTQGKKVLKALEALGGSATINQLWRFTGIFPHLVSARLNYLYHVEEKVCRTGETIIDKVSNKSNALWFKK